MKATAISSLAGLALIGTLAGVTLGRAAISEINPAYFGDPPTRFHADQTAQRPDWTQPQLASEGARTAEGLGSGCFGCSGGGEYYAAPAVVTYTESWTADAERAAAPVEFVPVEAAPDPERERVVRYASYPLTAEEAELEPAPAPEEVVDAEVAIE
jgi:hypothetical protein